MGTREDRREKARMATQKDVDHKSKKERGEGTTLTNARKDPEGGAKTTRKEKKGEVGRIKETNEAKKIKEANQARKGQSKERREK